MIKLCAFIDEAASNIEEQMIAMKRNNLSLMEVRNINGKNVSAITIEEAKEYQNIFEKNGVSVWSVGSPLGKVDINTPFSEYEESVRHICKLANVFKTDKIRMFSFFNAYEEKEKVFEYLRKMVAIANEYGVCLYHENEKEIYGDTVERVKEIMANVKGLKYIYDPANYLQTGEKSDYSISELHSKTDYFHIKDVIFETQQLVPAGYGDGNILKIIELIDKDTVLTLEPHLAIFAGYADIDGTEMNNKFKFSSNQEAFDTAVKSLKELLEKAGYKENGFEFIK